jgi:hypothetical protein
MKNGAKITTVKLAKSYNFPKRVLDSLVDLDMYGW